MRHRGGLLAFVVLVFASAQALAAPATPEGAEKILASMQIYFGKAPGVITVRPAGEAYDLTIDLAPLLAKIPAKEGKATMSPLVMKLADQGGGKWQVSQDMPWSFTMNVPGQIELTFKADKLASTGVFDANLMAFTSSTTDITGMVLDETVTTQAEGPTHIAYAIAGMHYESAATAAGDGAVDGTMHTTMTGIAETFSVPGGAGAPPVQVSVTMASGSQDGTMKGARTRSVADLLAWFVAHSSSDQIKPAQEELRSLLRAVLPVFGTVSGSGSVQNVAVSTPMGPLSIAKAGYELSMNGVASDGQFREKLTVGGLAIPPGLVPSWAEPAVPTDFTFDFGVSGFDLAAPAKIILDKFDLAKDKPLTPDLEQPLLTALLPKGVVTITLGPSLIASKIAAVGAEGSMTAGPATIPAGAATVTLKGIDELMALVGSAPPAMGLQQLTAMLVVAKGMAKPAANGGVEWKIESTPTGGVLINGIDASKM
ncbi:MAG: hypothetical protein HY245_09660 [Rhizobiales bacterium]|nr:hypothetical protein [Hyphomicrobiales bacterium]MBI3673668.1 hypothetical protein [Hyphomicrobiales bacterium]